MEMHGIYNEKRAIFEILEEDLCSESRRIHGDHEQCVVF